MAVRLFLSMQAAFSNERNASMTFSALSLRLTRGTIEGRKPSVRKRGAVIVEAIENKLAAAEKANIKSAFFCLAR